MGPVAARARRFSNQQQGEQEQMQEGIKRLNAESETSQRCLAALNKVSICV